MSARDAEGPLVERGLVKAEGGALRVLTFLLGREEYGVDISIIEEITRPIAVTYLPRVDPRIRGIAHLRGRVIPVLDLHLRLGLPPFIAAKRSRFIICQTDQGQVGFLAEKVNDIVSFSESSLQLPPERIAESNTSFIKNIGRIGERIVILLDSEQGLHID